MLALLLLLTFDLYAICSRDKIKHLAKSKAYIDKRVHSPLLQLQSSVVSIPSLNIYNAFVVYVGPRFITVECANGDDSRIIDTKMHKVIPTEFNLQPWHLAMTYSQN